MVKYGSVVEQIDPVTYGTLAAETFHQEHSTWIGLIHISERPARL